MYSPVGRCSNNVCPSLGARYRASIFSIKVSLYAVRVSNTAAGDLRRFVGGSSAQSSASATAEAAGGESNNLCLEAGGSFLTLLGDEPLFTLGERLFLFSGLF